MTNGPRRYFFEPLVRHPHLPRAVDPWCLGWHQPDATAGRSFLGCCGLPEQHRQVAFQCPSKHSSLLPFLGLAAWLVLHCLDSFLERWPLAQMENAPCPRSRNVRSGYSSSLFSDANGNPDYNGIMWLDPTKLGGGERAPCRQIRSSFEAGPEMR